MSKLNKIIDQASIEIANLSHPNTQNLQDQLSQIQESISGEITQDLIDQTNLVLNQIQEARLQSKEEDQIKDNIKLAEQNIFSSIYRLIERNSNLKLNIELNSILEKSLIEELIAFIQSDKLKLYSKENQKLKKQIQKYEKLKTQLLNFKISEHQVSFEHHTFSIDEFIEPIIQTTQNPLPEEINEGINETHLINLNENPKKTSKYSFKLFGLSTLLLSAITYFYNSNNTENIRANNIENIQFPTFIPEMELGYIKENSNRDYDILQAREFLISLKNTSSDSDSYSDFDLNDYCNYSYLHSTEFKKSILIKSQSDGIISSSACIYNSKTKSAHTLPTDKAFSLNNFKEYKILQLQIKSSNNQIIKITPIEYLKEKIDFLRKQSKRLIYINNQTQETIKALTNLKSINDLHNYPKIMQMIVKTGIVTNKKVYSTNLVYSESNFTFLDGTNPNLDSFVILSFRADEKNPNTLIVEFSNTDS